MPIKEKSFRIGCGRYLQGANILNDVADEISRLGKAPLVVGGSTSLKLTLKAIEDSINKNFGKYCIYEHTGTCNDEDAQGIATLAQKRGFDVIVGVGGGVIMDFAKLVAHYASLPIINVPTSSATCAAYTPLSVRYTREGKTVGSIHYEREVNAVMVDTAIVAKQPTRLLLAGVFDALAKFVEIKHRFSTSSGDEQSYPLGLDWAYVMSRYSYSKLYEKTRAYLSKCETDPDSEVIDEVIFTLIAATGVISGIARGSNQTALAHKFYEATRVLFYEQSKPYLHGEIVGIGLLIQNVFNGERLENKALFNIMKQYGMPCRLSDIGIDANEKTIEAYYELMKKSSAVLEGGIDAEEKLKCALNHLLELE